METKHVVISVVFVTFVILGFTMFIGQLNTNYNTNIDTSFNSTYNKIDDINQITNETYEKLYTSEITESNLLYTLSVGGFSAVKIIGNSVSLIWAMFQDVAVAVKLPAWFILGLFSIVLMIVVGLMLKAIFRQRQ